VNRAVCLPFFFFFCAVQCVRSVQRARVAAYAAARRVGTVFNAWGRWFKKVQRASRVRVCGGGGRLRACAGRRAVGGAQWREKTRRRRAVASSAGAKRPTGEVAGVTNLNQTREPRAQNRSETPTDGVEMRACVGAQSPAPDPPEPIERDPSASFSVENRWQHGEPQMWVIRKRGARTVVVKGGMCAPRLEGGGGVVVVVCARWHGNTTAGAREAVPSQAGPTQTWWSEEGLEGMTESERHQGECGGVVGACARKRQLQRVWESLRAKAPYVRRPI